MTADIRRSPEEILAALCAEPDPRAVIVDGLLRDGHDPLAARRRELRERHDGHPDPQSQHGDEEV